MKSIAFFLVSVTFFTGRVYCQSAGGQEFGADIKAWLKEGEHKVELMGVKATINPRMTELTSKMLKAAEKNAAWIKDSMATATDSVVMFEKFGLTKAEYYEYLALNNTDASKQEWVKTGDEKLVIKQKKNTLTFHGTGQLKVLDSLKFNILLNEPIYGGKEIEFVHKSESADKTNPFNSPWTGYHYSYENVEDIGTSVADMSATTISFDIGQLKSNGKVILLFMLYQVESGRLTNKATLFCQFD